MAILPNRLAIRVSFSKTLASRTTFAAFHRTTTLGTEHKSTPKLYLEDEHIVKGVGGITEEEGAGGKNPRDAEQYVLAGVPESEVAYGAAEGPYQTANHFEPPRKAAKPATGEFSSTSPDYAHPLLTEKAARIEGGVGSSSALRYRDSPGQMSQGSYGGRRLSAEAKATENTLGERGSQPQPSLSKEPAQEMKRD